MRLGTIALLFFVSLLANAFAAAPPEPLKGQIERQFRTWLETEIWPEAKAAGISRATFDKALGPVNIDWTLPELVLPGEEPNLAGPEIHPEFRSPAAYFSEKILADVVADGRKQLTKWDGTLSAIEGRFGVQKTILLAFWGRESSYGEERQPKGVFEAIATQAFIGKRKDVPREQLVPALMAVEKGYAQPAEMRGSWAGALGQPQLLPSDYLKFGADFDGDGRRDIWKSPPDALATMAGYIQSKGWKTGVGWGVEAKVPASVPCSLEGPDRGKPAAEWARLGVTTVSGSPLPDLGNPAKRFLLMPAGRLGPAFIVTENFYRLKEYNNSDLYALFVGQVSDRIKGGSAFKTPWTTEQSFSRAAVLRMQEDFAAEGRNVGALDGLVGFRTRIAIGEWQAAHGQSQTCFPDARFLAQFG